MRTIALVAGLVALVLIADGVAPADVAESGRPEPRVWRDPAPLAERHGRPAPTVVDRRRSCFRSSPAIRMRRPRRGPPWGQALREAVAGRDIGVAVASGDRLRFVHEAGVPRTPASNQKLLLSMALLDAFSVRTRFPTSVTTQRVAGHVVPGDVFVSGRGDPTLGDARYRASLGLRGSSIDRLARQIAETGIRRIEGGVVGARGFMASDWDAPGWQPYVRHRYVTRPTALSYNANQNAGMTPELQVAMHLTDRLESIGVDVAGRPRLAPHGPEPRVLAATQSPQLIDLITMMNRDSSNFMAEVLVKRLGARCFDVPGTIAKGARAVARWARLHGVPVIGRDGSGLSYDNRVSPRGVVTLLTIARQKRWGRELLRSLPGPGEGTLAHRLAGVRVRAKTGSLFDGSSALSGWVWLGAQRRWAAFSIMSDLGGDATAVEDAIVRMVARGTSG